MPCPQSHSDLGYKLSCCNKKTPKFSGLNIFLPCKSGAEQSWLVGRSAILNHSFPLQPRGLQPKVPFCTWQEGKQAIQHRFPSSTYPLYPGVIFCSEYPSSLPRGLPLQVCSLLAYSHVISPARDLQWLPSTLCSACNQGSSQPSSSLSPAPPLLCSYTAVQRLWA